MKTMPVTLSAPGRLCDHYHADCAREGVRLWPAEPFKLEAVELYLPDMSPVPPGVEVEYVQIGNKIVAAFAPVPLCLNGVSLVVHIVAPALDTQGPFAPYRGAVRVIVRGTYVDVDNSGARLDPGHWHQRGTVSGRFSSKAAAVRQVPRTEERSRALMAGFEAAYGRGDVAFKGEPTMIYADAAAIPTLQTSPIDAYKEMAKDLHAPVIVCQQKPAARVEAPCGHCGSKNDVDPKVKTCWSCGNPVNP